MKVDSDGEIFPIKGVDCKANFHVLHDWYNQRVTTKAKICEYRKKSKQKIEILSQDTGSKDGKVRLINIIIKKQAEKCNTLPKKVQLKTTQGVQKLFRKQRTRETKNVILSRNRL